MKTWQYGSLQTKGKPIVSAAKTPKGKNKCSIGMLHLEVLKGKRCMEACRTSCPLFLELEEWADSATQALVLVEKRIWQESETILFENTAYLN